MSIYFENLDQILDFAIENENEAYEFYSNLALRQADPEIQELLRSFAGEELNHKKRLKNAKTKRLMNFPQIKKQQLNPENYRVKTIPVEDLEYYAALTLAMKKELNAFRLYNDLAQLADDERARGLFRTMAQEEAIHKIRIEILYDEEFSPGTLEE